MLFNSGSFALFFPAVCIAYFATPYRLRWVTLLVASCVFYMAFIPAYVLILAGLILIDYTSALVMERVDATRRRTVLLASLGTNIAILALFKYYNFAMRTLAALAAVRQGASSLPLLAWALPLGLSFHTFQSMAYTIEVYRGRFRAEPGLGRYALYVMFYPQLVAGPIERPAHLLPQFFERHDFDPVRAASGLKLMAWGLFKKIVIADRLAVAVNTVYTLPSAHYAPSTIVATVFFAFQIYCDFSGYTDIAIGAAEVIGYRLMTNFRRPYLARSTREFWTRWHISLSTWFRDYVYVPLGGNRTGRPRWIVNVLVTFLISGLWHGANWTYIVWGGLNGLYLVAGGLTAPARERLRALLGTSRVPALEHATQVFATFALITMAWVFFRAASLHDAAVVFGRMTDWSAFDLSSLNMTRGELRVSFGLIAVLILVESFAPADDVRVMLRRAPAWIRWPAYYGVVLAMLLLGVFNESKFIYFQF